MLEALVEELGLDVNNGGSDGVSPLTMAAGHGHEQAIRALVKMGADIEAVDRIGQRPLLMAARFATKTAAVRTLVELGADIEAPSLLNGYNSLHAIWR
jgi:ankyrin repeat protein